MLFLVLVYIVSEQVLKLNEIMFWNYRETDFFQVELNLYHDLACDTKKLSPSDKKVWI